MLVFRKEQMRAMAQATLEAFQGRLTEQIREDFPSDAEALGSEKLKSVVRGGVEKALAYGFETERDLSRYLYLMFTFGAGFDKDPAFPWAREILALEAAPDSKMQQLYENAQQFEHLGRGIAASS